MYKLPDVRQDELAIEMCEEVREIETLEDYGYNTVKLKRQREDQIVLAKLGIDLWEQDPWGKEEEDNESSDGKGND